MRTTVTLEDDVAAAVEGLRGSDGIGMSDAVNRLIRKGLARPVQPKPYVHQSYDMGLQADVTNIGEVLGWLDETDASALGADGHSDS